MLKRDKNKSELIENDLQTVHGLVSLSNSEYTNSSQKKQYLTQAREKYEALLSSSKPELSSYKFLSFSDFVEQTKDIDTRKFIDWVNGISYQSTSPIRPSGNVAAKTAI